MASYPVSVPRKHYRGSKVSLRRKAAEYNSVAQRLEEYVNRKVEEDSDSDCSRFMYGYIAADTGLSEETVRTVLFGVDCGHNGLTVWKPGGYERWYRETHGENHESV